MTKAEWKPLQLRLQGLRTLAARTEFVEEARNAGLAFIRLVIKHNLVVLDPDLMEKEFAQVMVRERAGTAGSRSCSTDTGTRGRGGRTAKPRKRSR